MRLDADRIHDTLAELPVRVGENPQPDRVQVAAPGDVRARRFEAVFVCGLQEREFPRRSAPDAFLPDADRAELARASGLRLPLHEDYLARERYLFYVCASRAERLLVLSSRYCDEEGNPESPSFFLEDARAVFAGGLEDVEHRRSLADVTWSLEQAPTDAEWERAVARQGPRRAPEPVGLDQRSRRAVGARRPRRRSRRAPSRPTRAARSSGWWRRCCAPTRWSPTPSRWCAAPTRTACSRRR